MSTAGGCSGKLASSIDPTPGTSSAQFGQVVERVNGLSPQRLSASQHLKTILLQLDGFGS